MSPPPAALEPPSYARLGVVYRDFTTTTYRKGREITRTGAACRERDGNWHFD